MGITAKTYYEDDKYMSVSRWKKFHNCELDGLEPFGESKDSIPLLVGSYVDSYVEGTLDDFLAENPQIISSKGKTKGEIKAPFKQAELLCRYIDDDPTIQQFLSGEKQTIMTGEIGGVPFKIKMDSYSPGKAITDLKVMWKITDRDGDYYDFVTQWGYNYQLACYQEIVRQNTGETLPCFICAVTKDDTPNSVIIKLPQHVLDVALYEVETTIERYNAIRNGKETPVGCGKCVTCRKNRTKTPIISLDRIIENQGGN